MKIRITKKKLKQLQREKDGIVIEKKKEEVDFKDIKEERDKIEEDKLLNKKKNKTEKKEIVEDKDEKNKRDKILEEIKELEKRISTTKYNKKTQHAIGLYKAKLARLKERLSARSSQGKKGQGYTVKKSGDASVILIGFPSVGKSTLLNKLTNANSEIGAYEFTTLDVIPGMMNYNDAKIQILDVPGIVEGAAAGTGRGKEVLSVMQNADLILFLVDATRPENYKVIQKEVYDTHIRVNKEKPDVKIKKCEKGGIDLGCTVKLTKITEDMVKAILREYKIANAQVVIRSDISADELIDVIEKNKTYIPGITIINKIDMVTKKELDNIKKDIQPNLCIAANKDKNVDKLKDVIFKKLDFIRIYTKEVNKKPDMKEPMIMKKNSTVKDFCEKLHRDFINKFKFSKIWGKSAKFDGQILHLHHVLEDKDIVEIHLR